MGHSFVTWATAKIKSEWKYSENWNPPRWAFWEGWGSSEVHQRVRLRPSHPFSYLHTKPLPLCACTINCFGRKSFQIQGRWFSLMWSTFQKTQLLTILVNEIVLQLLAAQTPVNLLVLIFIQPAPLLGLALSWSKARPIPLGSLIAWVASLLITSRVCFWILPKALSRRGWGREPRRLIKAWCLLS